jgi:hypothetical protein
LKKEAATTISRAEREVDGTPHDGTFNRPEFKKERYRNCCLCSGLSFIYNNNFDPLHNPWVVAGSSEAALHLLTFSSFVFWVTGDRKLETAITFHRAVKKG